MLSGRWLSGQLGAPDDSTHIILPHTQQLFSLLRRKVRELRVRANPVLFLQRGEVARLTHFVSAGPDFGSITHRHVCILCALRCNFSMSSCEDVGWQVAFKTIGDFTRVNLFAS